LNQLEATLKILQMVAIFIAIVGAAGPILVGAFLWKLSKTFVTKDDFNGQGGRITAWESLSIQNRDRADFAH
jgi:hypothetical protein